MTPANRTLKQKTPPGFPGGAKSVFHESGIAFVIRIRSSINILSISLSPNLI